MSSPSTRGRRRSQSRERKRSASPDIRGSTRRLSMSREKSLTGGRRSRSHSSARQKFRLHTGTRSLSTGGGGRTTRASQAGVARTFGSLGTNLTQAAAGVARPRSLPSAAGRSTSRSPGRGGRSRRRSSRLASRSTLFEDFGLIDDRLAPYKAYLQMEDASKQRRRLRGSALSSSETIREACVNLKSKSLDGFITLVKRIGGASANGETWKGCASASGKRCSKDSSSSVLVAIKLMPLAIPTVYINENKSEKAITDVDVLDPILKPRQVSRYSKGAMQHESWVELLCLELARLLIAQGICNTLPLLYDYLYCPKCYYSNTKLRDTDSQCLSVINELARGDVRNWLSAGKRSLLEIKVLLFDILLALAVFQQYFGITHNDAHHGNALFLGAESSAVGPSDMSQVKHWRKYETFLGTFYRPVMPWTFVLWDFQFAHMPHPPRSRPRLIDTVAWKYVHRDPKEFGGGTAWTSDVLRFANIEQMQLDSKPHRLGAPIQEFLATIIGLASGTYGKKPMDIIGAMYPDWKVAPPLGDSQVIETYSLKRKLAIPRQLQQVAPALFVSNSYWQAMK